MIARLHVIHRTVKRLYSHSGHFSDVMLLVGSWYRKDDVSRESDKIISQLLLKDSG